MLQDLEADGDEVGGPEGWVPAFGNPGGRTHFGQRSRRSTFDVRAVLGKPAAQIWWDMEKLCDTIDPVMVVREGKQL